MSHLQLESSKEKLHTFFKQTESEFPAVYSSPWKNYFHQFPYLISRNTKTVAVNISIIFT